MRDSKAALDLLYRRTRRLYDFETENKNLEKARLKKKDEKQAESNQQLAKQKFETISEVARAGKFFIVFFNEDKIFNIYNWIKNKELADFKVRRNAMFKKSLTDFVEIQLKHTNVITF